MGIFSADTITDFVRRGDIVSVRRRLELGDDVNERRSFKSTPLIEAARRGNIAMMQLLLVHGADMELMDSSRLTALHSAIDEKKSAAAISLAQRGASANQVGFLDRTPLQCAIKKNLFEATLELLANGAESMVRSESNKVARDFIQSGPSHQQFVDLLEAYTHADSVTKAKNGDAMSAHFTKSMKCDEICDLPGAIQAKNVEALSTLLRATISEGNPEDMMSKHRRIQSEKIESTSDEEWRLSLAGILNGYERDTLMKVMQSNNALEQLEELLETIENPNWIKTVKLDNDWTPLHFAASVGNRAIVQYPLVDCGLTPLDVSCDGQLALDIALDGEADNELCWMLLQHTKKRTFSDRTAMLLTTREACVEALHQLVGYMTSVYDLRHILGLGFRALNQAEMHSVLLEAFEEVIREKLVFDDRAAVFFKMGLQECRRQSFISEAEFVGWDLKATKVNVENSEWVRQIKQSLHQVECRVTTAEKNIGLLHGQYSALRDALIQREEYELKRRTRDRLISLVSQHWRCVEAWSSRTFSGLCSTSGTQRSF